MQMIRLFKRDLVRETHQWVEQGLISQAQAQAICQRYGMDYEQSEHNAFGYFVLQALGYLFVGLAVITLIGANWDEIPRAVRMLGLITMTCVVNYIGFRHFTQQRLSAASLWLFLGGLCYGASIMLIAQIYHLGEHFPDGIFYWALGVLPVAMVTGSLLLAGLSSVLALIWFFVEWQMGFFPWLLPVFWLPLMWMLLCYRGSNLLFLLWLVGTGLWLETGLSHHLLTQDHDFLGVEHVFLSIGLFLICYGLGYWCKEQGSSRLIDYGTLMCLWALRFALLLLFVFSFAETWQELIEAEWRASALTLVISAVSSAVCVWGLWRARAYWFPGSLLIGLYLLTLIYVLTVAEVKHQYVLQVLTNLLLIGTGLWLLIRGISDHISHYFFLGVATILLTGFLRYMDLVGDYIGAATLFIVFAGILLAAARFWKQRMTADVDNTEGCDDDR